MKKEYKKPSVFAMAVGVLEHVCGASGGNINKVAMSGISGNAPTRAGRAYL